MISLVKPAMERGRSVCEYPALRKRGSSVSPDRISIAHYVRRSPVPNSGRFRRIPYSSFAAAFLGRSPIAPALQASRSSSQKRWTRSFSSGFFIISTKMFEARFSARPCGSSRRTGIWVDDRGHPLAVNPSKHLSDPRTHEHRMEGSLMNIFMYRKTATSRLLATNPCDSATSL